MPAQAAALAPGQAGPSTVAAHAASAAQRGAITGVVARPGGRAITGACVVASGKSGTARAFTDATGRYLLTVRPGRYTLHAIDCSASGSAASPALAKPVTVAAGQIATAGRITLRPARAQGGVWIGSGARAFAVTGWTGAHSWAMTAGGPRVAIGSWASARPLARPKQVVPASQAAGHGAISGAVTGNGVPLADICVAAFGPRFVKPAHTAKDGTYRLSGLRPGKYEVHFGECGGATANWLPQWFPNLTKPILRHAPGRVTVRAGKTTPGVNAMMVLGGEISGTVRSAAGKALASICVFSFGKLGRITLGLEAVSGHGGRYALHALFPGTYQVGFFRFCGNKGNFAPQWWRDKATQRQATKITIAKGTVVTQVDAALPRGGVITGVVTGTRKNGPKLAGICVFGRGLARGAPSSEATTASNGSYRLVGLSTSKYIVTFSRCRNRGNFLPGRLTAKVTVGRVTRAANIALQPGATVSGTVTNTHSASVGGICVEIQGAHGAVEARSASDGIYTADALATGSYRVEFAGGCGNAGSYAPQFYNGQTNSGSATKVALTAGQVTTGIDATMQPGATISGAVTDAAGNKLSGICVALTPPSAVDSGFVIGGIGIARRGTYTARNLTPGLYDVEFNCFGQPTLARQWYRAQPTGEVAQPVSAPAGVITSGVSAALPAAGAITGLVTNRTGADLRGICVQAVAEGTAPRTAIGGPVNATTGRHGTFTVRGLAPGTYDVQFSDCHTLTYGSQWFRDAKTEQAATPVKIAAGVTVPEVDATLRPGGSISGRVTGIATTGFPHCVIATDAVTGSSQAGVVARTGKYTITSLSTGSYRVSVGGCFFLEPTATTSIARAGLVAVRAPDAVTGITIKAGPAGSISGTVLGGPSATPQAGVCVVAAAANGDGTYSETITGAAGKYTASGLVPGKYQVYFGDPFCLNAPFDTVSGAAPQWFSDQPSRATAADVTVAAGSTAGGIDATLGEDGSISGTVTSQAAGNPAVAGECVTAVPVSPEPEPVAGLTLNPVVALTRGTGRYTLTGLLPGQYKVEFTTGCGDSGFTTQWWKHATAAAATVITVTPGATITGIAAVLHPTA